MNRNYGWKGTVEELFQQGEERIILLLTDFLEKYDFPVGELQQKSWRDTYRFLLDVFSPCKEQCKDLFIVFEYMLPLEKGRRPDVLLMLKEKVVVLEFKEKAQVLLDDIEQLIGYKEDLRKFHQVTFEKELEVKGYLVPTKTDKSLPSIRGIEILNKAAFIERLNLLGMSFQLEDEVEEWVNSSYQPLPTVTKATLDLFQNGHLPYIKSIEEGAISKTVNFVKKRIHQNVIQDCKKDIIFVSGVPGAGKTLVALKTLYDYNSYQFQTCKRSLAAIYLSGNGPLVNVLQKQLEHIDFNESVGSTYIKGVFEFKREYLNTRNIPSFYTIFFDEAQRAWDEKKMGHYRISEPEGLLQVGEKIYEDKGYVTIVCFIGDGQAIHVGEEQGLSLWQEALRNHHGWRVFIPPAYTEDFIDVHFRGHEELFLDTSIRSSFIDTSRWIEAVLSGDISSAKQELMLMQEKGYRLRLSRNYETCKHYIEKKNEEYQDLTYGLLVSSRAYENQVRRYTHNSRYKSFMKDRDAGNWFLYDSKTWQQGATEFVCQGLELDFPLVCFGGDYYLEHGEWKIDPSIYAKNWQKFSDFSSIVKNIYRVLLSRARKGMVLYIPDEERFTETYEMLIGIGIDEI